MGTWLAVRHKEKNPQIMNQQKVLNEENFRISVLGITLYLRCSQWPLLWLAEREWLACFLLGLDSPLWATYTCQYWQNLHSRMVTKIGNGLYTEGGEKTEKQRTRSNFIWSQTSHGFGRVRPAFPLHFENMGGKVSHPFCTAICLNSAQGAYVTVISVKLQYFHFWYLLCNGMAKILPKCNILSVYVYK